MIDKLKQLMEVKRQAEQLKRELESTTIDVSDVRGITVTIDGAQNFRSVTVEPTLLNAENKTRFEMDLLRSLNAAVKKSQALAAQKMRHLTGFDIPGLS